LVFGSAGIPAGEFTPVSPVLVPSLDGAVVDGAMAGGLCIVSVFSLVACAIAPTDPIAANAAAAAAAFKIFIRGLLFLDAPVIKTLRSKSWFRRKSLSPFGAPLSRLGIGR
jgi:hypothetical protein